MATPPASTPRRPAAEPLPTLRVPLATPAILERLDKASRRGKMPGFHRGQTGGPCDFWLEVFGKFLHRRLLARVEPVDGGSVIRFESRLIRWPVVVFWVAMALTVWPGVVLTDSLLATYFSWYPREFWVTCAWYLPLAILPIPWMWATVWKQSAAIADAEARASIGKVAAHLGAEPVPAAPAAALVPA